MTTGRQPSGVVEIAGEPFLVAMTPQGKYAWNPTRLPTQEGDPTRPQRKRINDWSRGLGDSRGAFRGAVEYAENAYLGAMGRILPGPKIEAITTGLDGTCMALVEVDAPASRILAGGGTKVAAINPASSHAVSVEHTFGAGSVLSMQRWNDQVAIALGDSVDYAVRSNAAGYSANGFSKKARCFGLVGNPSSEETGQILARGRGNTRSVCAAENITSVDNWSTELRIGKFEGNVNAIFSHNRWEYVLKDEGLYSFDEQDSQESNVLTDLEAFPSSENRFVFKWYDHVYVCTVAGLYRYIQQGAARTTGFEELELNESEIANTWPTAGVAFGRQVFVAVTDGTTTWIVQGRRARNEFGPGFGAPVEWTAVVDKFTGLCRVMITSAKSGASRIYYGAGANVRHFGVTRDGRPATFRDSGTVTVWMAPTDFDSPTTVKNFRSVEVIGRNAHADRAFQFKAKIDGGSSNNVGSAITALTATFAEAFWTLGQNDTGRVLQLGLTMACNSSATVPEVRDLFMNYEERPAMVPATVLQLHFEDQFTRGDVTSRKTAQEQREFIEGLLDGPPVTVVDMDGRRYTARVAQYQGETREMFRGQEPQVSAVLALRELDYG